MAETLIGDGYCQVRLATATGTAQDEPPLRLGGKSPGRLISAAKLFLIDGITASPLGKQIIKGEASQHTEIAVSLQAGQALLLQLLLDTAAGNHLAKIRFARRQKRMNDPRPFTNRAVWTR